MAPNSSVDVLNRLQHRDVVFLEDSKGTRDVVCDENLAAKISSLMDVMLRSLTAALYNEIVSSEALRQNIPLEHFRNGHTQIVQVPGRKVNNQHQPFWSTWQIVTDSAIHMRAAAVGVRSLLDASPPLGSQECYVSWSLKFGRANRARNSPYVWEGCESTLRLDLKVDRDAAQAWGLQNKMQRDDRSSLSKVGSRTKFQLSAIPPRWPPLSIGARAPYPV